MCEYRIDEYSCGCTHETPLPCDEDIYRLVNNPDKSPKEGCASPKVLNNTHTFCCDTQCCEKLIWARLRQNQLRRSRERWAIPVERPAWWLNKKYSAFKEEDNAVLTTTVSDNRAFRQAIREHLTSCGRKFAMLQGNNITLKKVQRRANQTVHKIRIPICYCLEHEQRSLEQSINYYYRQQVERERREGNIQDP